MPTYGENSLGRKLLLLGNWNEISEGHVILPTSIAGFGYLDKIREVFCKEDMNHKDILPQDVGMGPYDHLTPKLW